MRGREGGEGGGGPLILLGFVYSGRDGVRGRCLGRGGERRGDGES